MLDEILEKERGEKMSETNNIPMVTITADEYFDLRVRAGINDLMLQKMIDYESRLARLEERLWELEKKVNER